MEFSEKAAILQGIDDDINGHIARGVSVLEAQFRALYQRQIRYDVLSPEWNELHWRVEGAYQELLKHQGQGQEN